MGYYANGDGTLTVPAGVTAADLYTAAGKPTPDTLTGDVPQDFSTAICELHQLDSNEADISATDDGTICIDLRYNGKIGDWTDDMFTQLAGVGATGEVTFTGEEGAQWLVLLCDGKATQHDACIYYPSMPGGDVPVLLLTRDDVRECIAFLCGQKTDHQQELLERLTASLGN